jgi:protein-S-isoprenylcysteine O-methyltransferase Ste14
MCGLKRAHLRVAYNTAQSSSMDRAFALLALALFVVFLVVDSLARGYVHWRATGSTGTPQRASGLKPTDFIGGAVAFAGMAATVAGTALAAVGWLDAVGLLDVIVVRVAGMVLAVIGIATVWVAQSGMGASWRATVDYSERPDLVTTGLFAVIRNPIFTFIIIATAGLALMAPNVVTLLGVIVVALGIEVHVRRVEEPYLHWAHGDAYRDYASRVGRFVPGVGRIDIAKL